jgi:hypothetical protein
MAGGRLIGRLVVTHACTDGAEYRRWYWAHLRSIRQGT